MENRLDLAAYRLVADTERLRRGFQRSSCDDMNNEACLCRGQTEPIPKKCLRVLAADEGAPFAQQVAAQATGAPIRSGEKAMTASTLQ